MKKKWLVVIPARLSSSRLENKPLQLLGGVPLVVQTYRNLSPLLDMSNVIVAADSKEIQIVCEQYDVPCVMTKDTHESGTDRCFEVSDSGTFEHEFVLNVQGDEPFIEVDSLLGLMKSFEMGVSDMATLATMSDSSEDFMDPNVVKVVVDRRGSALYFSRAEVPFCRKREDNRNFLVHMGIYAYSRASLGKFCSLGKSALEKVEHLEQLRALENGMSISVTQVESSSFGIDTPADLCRANARFSE